MGIDHSDALVFFGATGDLAYKQIFPALQALARRGRLEVPIIGVAKSGWTLEQLQARARKSLEEHGGVDEAAFARLITRLRYLDADYNDEATYTRLREMLGEAKRPAFYLAIPPGLFSTVATGLGHSGCARGGRVILEKPFGRDLESARALNQALRVVFDEAHIFRIDHYLGALRPLDAAELVRGQFTGYRSEAGVLPESTVETFAALRLHIDSWRWEGAPFFLRAGKKMPVTMTEVIVRFKRPPLSKIPRGDSNYIRLRLGPEVAIGIGARVKKPGEGSASVQTELDVMHYPEGDAMTPYERLLGDAMAGDPMLFATEEGVEAAWSIVEPILGNATPLRDYAPGSWGPEEAAALTEAHGGWFEAELTP